MTRSIPTTTRARHTIDATDDTLGRIASRAAIMLRGKQKATFTPNVDGGDYVHVVNARGIRFTGQKITQHARYRHSGYPGGLRKDVLRERWARDPQRVLRETVLTMLPSNRQRTRVIKRLTVAW